MNVGPPATDIDEEKERAHFKEVVAAFKYYKLCSLDRIHKSETNISKLPASHQRRLEKYKECLSKFKQCLDVNNSVVHLIIKDVNTMFENVDHSVNDTMTYSTTDGFGYNYNNTENSFQKQHKVQQDVSKVQTVLKNIVRDWSDVGAVEREQCYKPILDEMEECFPLDEYSERSKVRVVVPGAGLGRLAWEVAARGYTCQGNEFSLFMLFASNFVLNRCCQINQYTVHPWLHQYVNNMSVEHQTLPARFPDVCPSGDTPNHNFSMVAGDFLKVYIEPNEWNCVATCFFIDCAPNVIEFVERIYHILEPGGYWINLGPLLYHYSDMENESSIEPSYDILLEIIKDIGFDVLKEKTGVKTKYAQNPKSMLQLEYDSVYFVCRKPLDN